MALLVSGGAAKNRRLCLAQSEAYGSVDACCADLAEALAQYAESVELHAP